MNNNIDRYMSRLNERVMSGAQHALDELGYALDEMAMVAENNPEREDIKSCVDEVKAKSKKALTECWATANHWSEHFDGISGPDEEKPSTEAKKDEGTDD